MNPLNKSRVYIHFTMDVTMDVPGAANDRSLHHLSVFAENLSQAREAVMKEMAGRRPVINGVFDAELVEQLVSIGDTPVTSGPPGALFYDLIMYGTLDSDALPEG